MGGITQQSFKCATRDISNFDTLRSFWHHMKGILDTTRCHKQRTSRYGDTNTTVGYNMQRRQITNNDS